MKDNRENDKQCAIQNVSNTCKELKDYSVTDIEDYLDTIGYSVIKTDELDDMEERLMNHPC
jgi:hypothetical protein